MLVIIKTIEGEQTIDAVRIEVQIGDNSFLINETVDKKLSINKSDGNDGNMQVHPRYANVVQIS